MQLVVDANKFVYYCRNKKWTSKIQRMTICNLCFTCECLIISSLQNGERVRI